jgi:sterol desaturase/sphingolipid hydroxylase (fatty acid hydroxylase superfamily)
LILRLDGGATLHPFGGLPRWALVAVVLVLMDLANWTSHLLNHRVSSFWRYHALHHTQEEMSILTSFRAHPLVHTSFQLAAVPLIVLGTGG